MNTKNLKLFTTIAAAMLASGAAGFIYADPKQVKALVEEDPPLLEGNPGLINPANSTEIAYRLTEAGKAEAAKLPGGAPVGDQTNTNVNDQTGTVVGDQANLGNTGTAPAGNTATATPSFVIKSGIALPKIERASRGGAANGQSKYPVDQLQPGQSFFIPSPAGMKSPSKTFGSMIATKNKQFGKLEDGSDYRRFTVRTVDGASWDQPGVKGVAIYRLDAAAEAAAKTAAKTKGTEAAAAADAAAAAAAAGQGTAAV